MTLYFESQRDGAYYARRLGYVTIVCQPKNKPPIGPWAERQKQRPGKNQYRNEDRKYPSANYGIVTGCTWDLIVLDQDGPEGLATLRRFGVPPRTVQVKSPSGPARLHYWFRAAGMEVVHGFVGGYNGDLPHLDLRADGNYVMCPGSIHPKGGRYQFVDGRSPEDLDIAPLYEYPQLYEYILNRNAYLERQQAEWAERAAKLGAGKARGFTLNRERAENPDRIKRYAEAALNDNLFLLRHCTPGERNSLLFRAAAALSRYCTAGVLPQALVEQELEAACTQNGLAGDDGIMSVRRTIQSGLMTGRYNPIVLKDRPQAQRV